MTIRSCKTMFGLTFSAILENLLESFFRKVPKTVILAIFWHIWPKSDKMRIFIKNRSCYFLPLMSPQLHAKFQKIVGVVSEIELTYIQGWYHRTGRFRWFNNFYLHHFFFIIQLFQIIQVSASLSLCLWIWNSI